MRAWIATCCAFVAFFFLYFLPAELGKLMASGDALYESLPAYLGAHNLWEPAMFLGYPLFADPNQQYWYPLAWLHYLPDSYNVFAVAPFVLAAIGMTGLVRSLTRSLAAGVVAGLVYALSGFMISHAGHLMLSHPAAWSPFVLWALESMRGRSDALPVVGGAIALGLCGVAGQPQIFVTAVTLAAAYALISAACARIGTREFLVRAGGTLALGAAFAATQLVPEVLLARDSTRASLSFDAFTSYEVPASQLALREVFPYVLGPTALHWYAFSAIDLGSFTEETIAVGLVSLALAFIALRSLADDYRAAFWAAVALVALVLAVGDATPLARVTHALPIYGLFRAPGRNAFEWCLAVAVLAGYGAAAVMRGRSSHRIVALAGGLLACIVVAAYIQLVAGQPSPAQQLAQAYGVAPQRIASPVENGALGIPLLTGVAGLLLVGVAVALAGSRAAGVLLVLAIGLDVGSFGWAAYWNWGAVSAQSLAPTPAVRLIAARARAVGGRVAWLPGTLAPLLAPNLLTLWGVLSIDGYTPLVPRRVAALLGVTASGGVNFSGDANDSSFDLAGASPVMIPAEAAAGVTAKQPFAAGDVHVFFGARGESAKLRAAFGMPVPVPATQVAMVSELGDSPQIAQGADVADLAIVYVNGHIEHHAIVAGRDTAEFAYDRADVRARVQHRRARIFDGDAATHRYVAYFSVASYVPIAAIEIEWRYPESAAGALTVDKLSLVDGRRHTAEAYGDLASFYAAPQHWIPINVDPAIVGFQNERALPGAWIARPIAVDAAQALQAVRAGKLPGGGRFDPRREGVVEAAVSAIPAPAAGDRVREEDESPKQLLLTSTCARACFLIVRNSFDSNWRASVDGVPATILPVDVALSGLVVPAGTHRIRFSFVPISLHFGMAMTGLALAVSLMLLWRQGWRTRKLARQMSMLKEMHRRKQPASEQTSDRLDGASLRRSGERQRRASLSYLPPRLSDTSS